MTAAYPAFITWGRGIHENLKYPLRIPTCPGPEAFDYPCFKLVFLESGSGTVTVNGITAHAAAPSLICLNDTDKASISDNFRFSVILFLPEVLNGSLTLAAIREKKVIDSDVSAKLDDFWMEAFLSSESIRNIPLMPHSADCMKDWISRMRHELEDQECRHWPSWARSFLTEALFLTGHLYHNSTREPDHPAHFPEHPAVPVLLYLQAHYPEKLTLQNLSREFHTNRTSLSKLLLEYTGKNFSEYLREHRLSVARSLLTGSRLAISVVADKTGFADPTNFTRAFRKAYGMTPVKYRLENRKL